ncbi:hypothetical protein TSUD_318680 [Trifolium subterraneum]|uniref:At3g05675-like ankyrin-like domain-containing protein n=1 Tax=Trifolium subterraneum TaxID=3900 RepID=A0A2Z6N003_TRISU|nr:hypothetical protein TSUD_318680 [Trifolium subterraneum]
MDSSSYHRRRHRTWCCSFAVPPSSPDINPPIKPRKPKPKPEVQSKPTTLSSSSSIPNSPQSSKSNNSRIPSRIDPRRILSPGRVSPIEDTLPNPSPLLDSVPHSRSRSFRAPVSSPIPPPPMNDVANVVFGDGFDVRMSLRGKNGGCIVLELNSVVLCANSEVFAGLIADYRKGSGNSNCSGGSSNKMCRIEVPEVDNLGVFRETIELMFEDDVPKKLLNIGVYRSIDVLEVSAGIMFTKGVLSCLQYLEAVPWTEEEEEKLRNLFTRFKFDDETTRDILGRLYLHDSEDSQPNATDTLNPERLTKKDTNKPMIERISRQVDNINWLLEIMLDGQIAEDFVDIWSDQHQLLKMHDNASPMVRYELSRVSAILFVAMATRKLQCRLEARSGLLQAWFAPMLLDFGWLQRCRKGLDIKVLQEAMGQTLLTLPLKQQHTLFMEWFHHFSRHGTECPNLSKAFQIWWRRSFLRGSETYAIESR